MSEEISDDSTKLPEAVPVEEQPAAAFEAASSTSPASSSSSSKKKKKKKKMDHQTRVRLLMGAIAVSVIAFIYTFMHWLDVVREASNPNSENARMGRYSPGVSREELEADERRFPLHPSPSPSR